MGGGRGVDDDDDDDEVEVVVLVVVDMGGWGGDVRLQENDVKFLPEI